MGLDRAGRGIASGSPDLDSIDDRDFGAHIWKPFIGREKVVEINRQHREIGPGTRPQVALVVRAERAGGTEGVRAQPLDDRESLL